MIQGLDSFIASLADLGRSLDRLGRALMRVENPALRPRRWAKEELKILRARFPHEQTARIAKAVAEVAKVIVESAKAETDHLRVTGSKRGSGFIPSEEKPQLGKPDGVPPPVLKVQDGKGYTGKLQGDKG